MASSELNMEEEEAPDHKDSNIELGSVQGPEGERSDGEMWAFYQHFKYLGFTSLQASTN